MSTVLLCKNRGSHRFPDTTIKIYQLRTLSSLLSVLFYQTTWSDFFRKVFIKRLGFISEKIDRNVLFQGHHGQFLVSIKQPGVEIWK